MKALLFSGGIDSTAIAWWLRPERLFFVDYGQASAKGERRAAEAVAKAVGLTLDAHKADLSALGHGAMAKKAILNPDAPEFWPYRNQMLITLAVMAYAQNALESIVIGSVVGDDKHPDGTSKFRSAMTAVLLAQGGPLLEAPGAEMSTEQLVSVSQVPLSVLGWTFSCHTGEWACGSCRGCIKHSQVMSEILPTGVAT